jgi:hypothetical protein
MIAFLSFLTYYYPVAPFPFSLMWCHNNKLKNNERKGIHLPHGSFLYTIPNNIFFFFFKEKMGIVKEMSCGRLNASWKISSSAVDGQSFLVIDGSLLN